ncbi:expressed unknown protein [Seminavis robusta]|uniref:Uncharacterized protein n=1 Tax=Seminavis robusta TaxID=568900 RepID=A0A9N8DR68_9STRA|nr:expressed unknown protein [Seminavis robusta]|eukprot:Sro312_g114600.1 n/a (623) ;mRNA; r:35752-37620
MMSKDEATVGGYSQALAAIDRMEQDLSEEETGFKQKMEAMRKELESIKKELDHKKKVGEDLRGIEKGTVISASINDKEPSRYVVAEVGKGCLVSVVAMETEDFWDSSSIDSLVKTEIDLSVTQYKISHYNVTTCFGVGNDAKASRETIHSGANDEVGVDGYGKNRTGIFEATNDGILSTISTLLGKSDNTKSGKSACSSNNTPEDLESVMIGRLLLEHGCLILGVLIVSIVALSTFGAHAMTNLQCANGTSDPHTLLGVDMATPTFVELAPTMVLATGSLRASDGQQWLDVESGGQKGTLAHENDATGPAFGVTHGGAASSVDVGASLVFDPSVEEGASGVEKQASLQDETTSNTVSNEIGSPTLAAVSSPGLASHKPFGGNDSLKFEESSTLSPGHSGSPVESNAVVKEADNPARRPEDVDRWLESLKYRHAYARQMRGSRKPVQRYELTQELPVAESETVEAMDGEPVALEEEDVQTYHFGRDETDETEHGGETSSVDLGASPISDPAVEKGAYGAEEANPDALAGTPNRDKATVSSRKALENAKENALAQYEKSEREMPEWGKKYHSGGPVESNAVVNEADDDDETNVENQPGEGSFELWYRLSPEEFCLELDRRFPSL